MTKICEEAIISDGHLAENVPVLQTTIFFVQVSTEELYRNGEGGNEWFFQLGNIAATI